MGEHIFEDSLMYKASILMHKVRPKALVEAYKYSKVLEYELWILDL